MQKKSKNVFDPISLLKNKKYHISFSWIDKERLGILKDSSSIIINQELFLTDTVIHELMHGEGEDLPSDYDEEEEVVSLRTKVYMKKEMSPSQIRRVARYVIEYDLIPYLMEEYPEAVVRALMKRKKK